MQINNKNLIYFLKAVEARHDKEIYKHERYRLRQSASELGKHCELHHIIPISSSHHYIPYCASKAGWHINDSNQNGLPLPKDKSTSQKVGIAYHRDGGNHKRYNDKVNRCLDEIERKAKRNNWSDRHIRTELEKAVQRIIQAISKLKPGDCIDKIELSI